MKRKILVIDDHSVVLQGIKSLIDSAECGRCLCASNLLEAEKILNDGLTDMAIVDLELGADGGMSVVSHLRNIVPSLKIIVYTMHEELWVVREMQEACVEGVVFKSEDVRHLLTAIKELARGNTFFSPRFREISESKNISALSKRELEVLRLIAEGLSSNRIASELYISENTVEYHRKKLLQHFCVATTVQLVLKARRLGVV